MGEGCLIFDGYAIATSWSKPMNIVYEVKVDRNDFLHDVKWHKYLPFCNELYFVCPKDLILPNELPKEAGLMYKCKSKLIIKKKAQSRMSIQIPDSVYKYILMWRSTIKKSSENEYDLKAQNTKHWQDWLQEKKVNKVLGYSVSKALREEIDKKVVEVEEKNIQLEKQIEGFTQVKKLLESLNIKIDTDAYWNWKQRVKEDIDEITSMPNDLRINIERTIEQLAYFKNRVLLITEKKGDKDATNKV
jgi:hypothetical protein